MAGMTHAGPWLPGLRPGSTARLRLFAFPYAGAGPGIFQSWPQDLPDGVEVAALLLPGRERRLREPAFHRMEPLVEALALALQPYLDRPFAFFGHSMGALTCYELACRLEGQGGPQPTALFLSGRRSPSAAPKSRPMHNLSDAELQQELRRIGGTPPEIFQYEELLRLLLPTLRADFAVVETYAPTPRPPLRCPIRAFGGWEDSLASREDLSCWRDYTQADFRLHMFAGGHFFIQTAATRFLEALRHELELLLAGLSSGGARQGVPPGT
jgi:medium-chain acyl-[acyl-carrier-protein] hydrolase